MMRQKVTIAVDEGKEYPHRLNNSSNMWRNCTKQQ